MTTLFVFFRDNIPSFHEIALGFGPFLFWAALCLWLAGTLKKRAGLKTGYSRKIFHFAIFSSAAAVQALWGIRILCLFGGAVSLVIFYALLRGEGHLLFEAVARESDAPRRRYYVIVPYIATLAGGITANAFWGDYALIGYLVTGLGDAVGEPVGVRFGRHPYRVPAAGVDAIRTLEGSFAVFTASFFSILLGLALMPGLNPVSVGLPAVLLLAAGATLLEAVAPHGWDNALLQAVTAALAALLF